MRASAATASSYDLPVFATMFRALERAKYGGFLTLELYPYKDKPGEAGEEGLRFLKSGRSPA